MDAKSVEVGAETVNDPAPPAATVDVPLTMTVKLMFREMTTVLEDPSILAAYQDQVDSLFVPVDLNNNAWKINKAANFAINTAAMFQA